MKKYCYIAILSILFISCQKAKITSPSAYFNQKEQEDFKYKLVRYYEDLAPNASHLNKFDSTYKDYYTYKAKKSNLLYLYKVENSKTYYFAITKIAPSLTLKKVATLGYVTFDKNNSVSDYEEVARTWKMPQGELETKTKLLFEKMINKEDLSAYYPQNSSEDLFIEFPDATTFYNKSKRIWEKK